MRRPVFRRRDSHSGFCTELGNLIRRFLLHVLPEGLQRIRYYGFLANCYREQKLALCRQLLQSPPPEHAGEAKTDYRDRYEELTGKSLQ